LVNYLNIIHIFFQKIDIATAQERDEFEATPDVPAAPNDDDDLDPDDDDVMFLPRSMKGGSRN